MHRDWRHSDQLFLVSGPSGAGKTTLIRRLLLHDPRVVYSVSVTTRMRSQEEVEGVDYQFISLERFFQMRDQHKLLEWQEVHGNFYGTPRAPLQQALENEQTAILEVHTETAAKLRVHFPRCRLIFVTVPNIDVLKERLNRRGRDSHQTIAQRLEVAKTELWAKDAFDHVIVNDSQDQAFRDFSHLFG